jgi:hypothetical protein
VPSLSKKLLLAEIDNIVDTMPLRATIHQHDSQENVNWFGRVADIIERWNPSKSSLAKEHLDLFFSNRHARERTFGLTKLLTLLSQAQAELRLEIGKVDDPAQIESEQPGGDSARSVSSGIVSVMGKNIFIGHGRSLVWLQLKEFLTNRLSRTCVEFNSDVVAGKTTTARLQEMLDDAGFAFLVMTAEDTHADSSAHARENVIHEAGLFQGRIGFERAILLLEEGCAQFSNIHGLTHIPFPKGNLEPAFEKIRQVLEREYSGRNAPLAETVTGEQCPKCLQNGWHVESTAPDPTFRAVGVSRRIYKCRFCGFSEPKLVP